MARKEINIFNLSFLDLISGALGAVVLLFIIVPKMDIKQQQDLEALNKLNVQVESLSNIIEQARNSIPKEIFEQIEKQLNELKQSVDQLEQQVENLQQQLADCQERTKQLEEQVRQQTQTINQQQQQIENLEQRLRQCQDSVEVISGQVKFAIITTRWETEGDDIDLHVTDPSGAEFSYQNPTVAGRSGRLSKDDTSGPGFEVWQINEAAVGTYKLEVVYYAKRSSQNPIIETWIYYRNGTREFRKITLSREGERSYIGSFTVANDGTITFSN